MSNSDAPAPNPPEPAAAPSSGSEDDGPPGGPPPPPDDDVPSPGYSPHFGDDVMLELYRIYRSYEEHENVLLNQRVTWLITLQSVLIGAFAFLIHKSYELADKLLPRNPASKAPFEFLDQASIYLLAAIATAGALFASLALIGVVNAVRAQWAIRAKWAAIVLKNSQHPLLDKLPALAGGGAPYGAFGGSLFAFGLPSFFLLMWGGAIAVLIFYPRYLGVSHLFSLLAN